MNADLGLAITILLLMLVLMFLAIAETGLSRMNKPRAYGLAESAGKRGEMLLGLVSKPETFLNPILLTVNICQTVQATMTGILAERLFGVPGVIVGVVLNVVVFFVLAEALPKTWAVLYPDRAALFAARPVSVLVRFWPLRLVARGLIGLANVLLPGKGLKQGPFVSEEELLAVAESAAEENVIEHEERDLIESVIEFGDTVAREVMVPRPDMVTVAAAATVSDALSRLIEHGFSRMPVTGRDIDDIVGIGYTKDLVRAERSGHGGEPVSSWIRSAKFIPETKQVTRLMREMQSDGGHMAILLDEYGGVAGLVTLEDLIEELIGDIVDEYDTEAADVEHLEDGSLLVAGSYGVHDLGELLDLELPSEDWDTVAGFVFGMLGHVPTVGEAVTFGGRRFEAERVVGRRISRVRIAPARVRAEDAEHVT